MGDEGDAPKLHGQAVLDSRWGFEQVIGADRVAAALASLPDHVRQTYEAVTPLTWLSYEVIHEVHDAYEREAGVPFEQLLERVLPLSIERSFSTVWRVLLRLTSDRALIARTPLLYRRTRSHGTMQAETVAPGDARVELTGWPGIPPRDVCALTISIASLIRLAGRTGVEVEPEKTEEGARWRVRWATT